MRNKSRSMKMRKGKAVKNCKHPDWYEIGSGMDDHGEKFKIMYCPGCRDNHDYYEY